MRYIKRGEYFRWINFLFCLIFLFICISVDGIVIKEMVGIVSLYFFMGMLCSVLPTRLFFSWPVIFIRVTGFFRYFLIPYAMSVENISYGKNNISYIIVAEMIAMYFTFFLFSSTQKSVVLKREQYDENNKTIVFRGAYGTKTGVTTIAVLVIAGIYVISNRAILENYVNLSGTKVNTSINGVWAILISAFFLIVYIKVIEFIESINIKNEKINIIFLIFVSVFFVNGVSISSNNVSRWSLMLTSLIAYTFIIKLYPKYKKHLFIILGVIITVVVFIGSMIKFTLLGSAGYSSISETLNTLFSYRNLNAYFSGPRNLEIGFRMIDSIKQNHISRIEMFVSDVFSNFPLLNKFLCNRSITSTVLFNRTIYGSNIASDQIVPLATQLYVFFGYFFVIPEMFIVYSALKAYFSIEAEKDLLKIYCLICLTFWLSLGNCIHMTIMLQNLWIQILPIYIIYKFNYRIVQRK